jgi:N-methylhydantoinase A/acetone carboxylase, beta subunit
MPMFRYIISLLQLLNFLICYFCVVVRYPEHEEAVGCVARQLGFKHVSLSHQVMPMVRIVPRGFTACADAYLTPHIHKYVSGFARGFKENLAGVSVLFMQSDGGLTPMDT